MLLHQEILLHNLKKNILYLLIGFIVYFTLLILI